VERNNHGNGQGQSLAKPLSRRHAASEASYRDSGREQGEAKTDNSFKIKNFNPFTGSLSFWYHSSCLKNDPFIIMYAILMT
jgi:hypothetical protein